MVAGGRRPAPLVAASIIAAATGALLSACGANSGASGPPPTPAAPIDGAITVQAFEWGYEPETLVLQRGEQVRIVLDNDGTILHNFKIDDLEADLIESVSTGPLSGGEDQVFVGADQGQQGTLTFVPLQAGEFSFYCTLEQHRQLGMEGTLIVE